MMPLVEYALDNEPRHGESQSGKVHGLGNEIITTGIDLSVGSLIALSGVLVACSARELGINPESGILLLFACVLLGIVGCGLLGTFSGVMVTAFGIHPFIVTLSIMSIARGLSYIIADGPSDVVIEAESYRFLGAGRSLLGIPNSVILMILLYLLAHLVMTRTVLGRHIYAVGGNREAAHLSGVPVKRVLIIVYTICGVLAGLGGVVNSSLYGAGSAKSGVGYELQIIAAVVVGGTSLAFMALTFYALSLVMRRELIGKNWAKYQPWLFAIGISMVSTGMSFAGILAIPRRHYDVSFSSATFQVPFSPTATTMLGLIQKFVLTNADLRMDHSQPPDVPVAALPSVLRLGGSCASVFLIWQVRRARGGDDESHGQQEGGDRHPTPDSNTRPLLQHPPPAPRATPPPAPRGGL